MAFLYNSFRKDVGVFKDINLELKFLGTQVFRFKAEVNQVSISALIKPAKTHSVSIIPSIRRGEKDNELKEVFLCAPASLWLLKILVIMAMSTLICQLAPYIILLSQRR
jgi:hypothetical protein